MGPLVEDGGMTADAGGRGDGNRPYPPGTGPPVPMDGLIGDSEAFAETLRDVERRIGAGAPTLLLHGEPGTGKTLLAHRVHYRAKPPEDPVVSVRCSTLPPRMLETELFGAPPGSFPGQEDRKPGLLEVVGDGTLVLEEIEELPVGLQERLGGWIEAECGNGEGPCRIVAISQKELGPDTWEDGSFAAGLAALLEPNTVEVPPLRHRNTDLDPLARHFLRRWAEQRGRPVPHLEPEALEALRAHPWPGNVRELKEVVCRAAELAPGRRIRTDHLRIQSRWHRPPNGSEPAADMIMIPADGKSWESIEEEALHATLALTGGNRSAAARILGISRPTLRRKIRKYALPELPAPRPR